MADLLPLPPLPGLMPPALPAPSATDVVKSCTGPQECQGRVIECLRDHTEELAEEGCRSEVLHEVRAEVRWLLLLRLLTVCSLTAALRLPAGAASVCSCQPTALHLRLSPSPTLPTPLDLLSLACSGG